MALLRMQCRGGVYARDTRATTAIEAAASARCAKRFDPCQVERLTELCRRLARFVADNIDTFEASDPKLPECAFNRLADNWRPLFASAEILLADLKQKFTDDRIFSKDLVELLAQMKERLWPEVCRGKPITERWLARQLHSFKIVSSNIRIGAEHKSDLLLLENCLSQNVRSKSK